MRTSRFSVILSGRCIYGRDGGQGGVAKADKVNCGDLKKKLLNSDLPDDGCCFILSWNEAIKNKR